MQFFFVPGVENKQPIINALRKREKHIKLPKKNQHGSGQALSILKGGRFQC